MIRLLNNNDLEQVNLYLGRHEIETTFIIGNVCAFGLENNIANRRGGDYYGYFEDNILRGILPFYNLGSCIPHYETSSAIPFFAELMKDRKFEFLLGMKKIIDPLYDQIKNYKDINNCSEDSYFVNHDFKPFSLDGVSFIEASADNEEIIEYAQRANLEGFGNKKSREDVINSISYKPKEEDYIFLVANGKIRAQANIQTTTQSINQVGGVFTSSEERGKGYCKALVSEICRRITDRGKTPTLMVRKNNTPAVRAYSSLGFKYYGDYMLIKFNI